MFKAPTDEQLVIRLKECGLATEANARDAIDGCEQQRPALLRQLLAESDRDQRRRIKATIADLDQCVRVCRLLLNDLGVMCLA